MKNLNIIYKIAAIILVFTTFSNCSSNKDSVVKETPPAILSPSSKGNLPTLEFKEVWGYVVAGREASLTKGLPITDVAYFSAAIDAYGNLVEVPNRSKIPAHFTGRVHLVLICNGYGLSHFMLKPGSPERKRLISSLIAATSNYDGLNIDMENVPALDGEAFASFLRELRAGLPKNKMFTICVPARTRKLQTDAYDYDRITPLVDRVFVMAYDEHWSGSRPGSVASINWCRNVAAYSIKAIGPEKLVMGLPFYGRTWGDYSPSRALVHSSVENVIRTNNVKDIKYENGVPTFTYNKNVNVKVYYEDEYSLVTRMNMYKSMGVNLVGFWRMGQETPEVWKYLAISSKSSTASASVPPQPAVTSTASASSASPVLTNASVTTPAEPVTPAAPAPSFGRYTVKRGDSLWTISKRYGITPQALADLNGMKLNDTLFIGKVLRVPAR